MTLPTLGAFALYLLILLGIGLGAYRKQKTNTDFIIGGRSLNFYVTALSAHASDMSSWLFMAYPAMIYLAGGIKIWAAVGLIVGMYCNWQFIAPRLRSETEKHKSLTLSAYFGARFKDDTGILRWIGALVSLLFFTVYVSAGLVGIGFVVDSVLGFDPLLGMSIGVLFVILYTIFGGFNSICWIDLFQAIFLLVMLIMVPFVALGHVGGWSAVTDAAHQQSFSLSPWPSGGIMVFVQIVLVSFGWGLGYFGQPHILNKFMGIKHPEELKKAKWTGISWMLLCFVAATLVGLIGVAYFPGGVENPELIFILITKALFHPFVATFILCAILAATISTMDSQILVLTSTVSEDIYHRILRRKASNRESLWVTRISVVVVGLLSYLIAILSGQSVEGLVFYSWSGLGSTFGPVLMLALYSKRVNKWGAIFGMVFGGLVAAIWPLIDALLPIDIPALIPGFVLNIVLIYLVSLATGKKHARTHS